MVAIYKDERNVFFRERGNEIFTTFGGADALGSQIGLRGIILKLITKKY